MDRHDTSYSAKDAAWGLIVRILVQPTIRSWGHLVGILLVATCTLASGCTFDRSGLASKSPRADDVVTDFGQADSPQTDTELDGPEFDVPSDSRGDELATDSGDDSQFVDTPDLAIDEGLDRTPDVPSEDPDATDPDIDSTSDTTGPSCGDLSRNGNEDCEGSDLGDADCVSQDFDLGILACSEDCEYDTSGCVTVPDDWFDSDWLYRKPLTISAANVVQDEVAFPVLVSTSDASLAELALATGYDLVFTAADGVTGIPFEIERWENGTGTLVAWVRVASLSGSEDTLVYLYYGNPEADEHIPADLGPVWDNGFEAVWHFGEATVDEQAVGNHVDSTGNGHTGSQNGNAASLGQIGRAQHFDGADDLVTVATGDTIELGNASVTISAWVETSNTTPIGIVVKALPSSHEPNDKLFGINHETNRLGIDQGWVTYVGGTSTITDGDWHHVVWVQEANANGVNEQWRLYVDGGREGDTLANTSADPDSHILRIGDGVEGSYFANPFAGAIDEVRISSTARSDGWIGTSFNNQADPGVFVSFGSEQSLFP